MHDQYHIGMDLLSNWQLHHDLTTIYLWIDNAGGHGKKDVIAKYKRILKHEFNIEIEWQIANSPELNMLDLGVWMAIQSLVERAMRGKVIHEDIVSDIVEDSFYALDDEVLTKVFER